jgi:hypothetical protein
MLENRQADLFSNKSGKSATFTRESSWPPSFLFTGATSGRHMKFSSACQKSGKDFATHPSFSISCPSTASPAMAKLMAIR